MEIYAKLQAILSTRRKWCWPARPFPAPSTTPTHLQPDKRRVNRPLHTGLIVGRGNEWKHGEHRTEAVPTSGDGMRRRPRFRSLPGDVCGPARLTLWPGVNPISGAPITTVLRTCATYTLLPSRHKAAATLAWGCSSSSSRGGGAAEHKLVPGLRQNFASV